MSQTLGLGAVTAFMSGLVLLGGAGLIEYYDPDRFIFTLLFWPLALLGFVLCAVGLSMGTYSMTARRGVPVMSQKSAEANAAPDPVVSGESAEVSEAQGNAPDQCEKDPGSPR